MLVAKEAEQESSGSEPESIHRVEKEFTLTSDHLKVACFYCGKLGHYKSTCRDLNGTMSHYSRGDRGRVSRAANARNNSFDPKYYLSLMTNTMAGNKGLKIKWIL